MTVQVTFAAKQSRQVNSSPSRIIKLFGVTYHLYSQGLPLFGQVFYLSSVCLSFVLLLMKLCMKIGINVSRISSTCTVFNFMHFVFLIYIYV